MKYYIIIFCRIFLGGVFVWASIHKILDPVQFLGAVEQYEVLPKFFEIIVAAFLPWLELVAGLFLIFGIYIKGSSLAIGGMNLAFIYGISINLLRGRSFDCGCFGLSPELEMLSWGSLIRVLVLLVVSVVILVQPQYRWTIQLKSTINH